MNKLNLNFRKYMDRSQYCLEKGLNSSWKFFAFVLVAVCFWEDTFAQVEHLTNDIRVDEEPTSSFSGFPAVAVDSNDGFLIVWGDNLFDQGKVLARRFNSIGEPLGPEFQVDQSDQGEAAVSFNGGFGFADLIDIAVNNNDEFIIVWQDIRTDTSRILARIFDGGGAALTDEFRVDQTPFGASAVAPAVATDSKNNDIIVAWTRVTASDNLIGVFARRLNGNGDPIGDEFRVDLNTRPVGNSDIATDALDRVIAVWIDAGDALGENVFARRFDNNNTFLEPPFQVDIDPGEFGNQPIDAATIAADNDGGFVVVWRESDVVLYRRFDSSANPLTSEINVAPSTGVGSSFPDVAIDNQNIITILYPRREAVPESGDLVFARRFDENDNPIGEELRVDQGGTIDFNTHVAVATFSNGNFVNTWQLNDGGEFNPFGQIYTNIIGTPPPRVDVVINEVLYNPNYDDLGTERIELKNVGPDSISLDNTSLFVTQIVAGDTLTTSWAFPPSLKIAPGELLVVHWLTEGVDDQGNLFTGLPLSPPDDTLDAFTGNNSRVPDSMRLGGPDNQSPFGIGILESNLNLDLRQNFQQPLFNLLDGVIFGDLVSDPSTLPDFTFSNLLPEGHSLEIATTAADSALTAPTNFFVQASPSIGFPNSFTAPPASHLLITELCVRPLIGEFVEIFNPTDATIDLADYYLTDNINFRDNAYTLLVNGEDALNLSNGDFLVKFPDNAVIEPDSFQTITFDGNNFQRRYRQAPIYEILDTARNVTNMETIRLGAGTPTFGDPNEVVILLKWDGSSDLVKDVDYLVWGEFTDAPVIPIQARLADAGESPEAVIPAGPLNEAVDKTGLGIDGLDADSVRSYYDNETADSLQTPVGEFTHAFLKSWQRRPGVTGRPREFGELMAGGNGISGHDETSEKLSVAFREETPTPGSGFTEPDNQLDVVIDSIVVIEDTPLGLPNGLINPGESTKLSISLRNLGPLPTGSLFTVLRSADGFAAVSDSVANFPSIEPDSSRFAMGDTYLFSVVPDSLPDSLAFVLRVVQKTPGAKKGMVLQSVKEIFLKFSIETTNVSYDLLFNCAVSPGLPPHDTLFFDFKLVYLGIKNFVFGTFLTADGQQLDPIGSLEESFSIMAKSDTTELNTFSFRIPQPFNGEPVQIPLQISWIEGGVRRFDAPIMCMSPDSVLIKGKAAYFLTQAPVESAQATLNCPTFSDTTETDSLGSYTFLVKFNGSTEQDGTKSNTLFTTPKEQEACLCTLRVIHDIVPDSALTIDDVEAAMRITIGDTLSLYQLIAADVNEDGAVTMCTDDTKSACEGDVELIHNRICFPLQRFWERDWVFVDKHFQISRDNWPEAPERIIRNIRHYSLRGIDFIGLIKGDADGEWPANPPEPRGCNADTKQRFDEELTREKLQ